jgi:hypothetical protein
MYVREHTLKSRAAEYSLILVDDPIVAWTDGL